MTRYFCAPQHNIIGKFSDLWIILEHVVDAAATVDVTGAIASECISLACKTFQVHC